MARRATEGPTGAEVEILQILWSEGPCTVQDVHDALNKIRATGYTTALKLMQLMLEKGLLGRDESSRRHVYHAVRTREEVQKHMLGSVVDRFFNGSRESMVLSALQAKTISQEEINRIRELLNEYEAES